MTRGRPARILQLAKYYPPEWGGIETVTRDLAEGFRDTGFDSEVIAFTRRRSRKDIVQGITVHRFRAVQVASQPISLAWLWRAMSRWYRADVVIVHWPNLLPVLLAPLALRTPFILFWHSDIVDKGLLRWLALPLQAFLLRFASLIVTTSQSYLDGSTVLLPFKGKAVTVPIGIADPMSGAESGAVPDDIEAIIQGRRLLLAVGRLVRYKGFHELVTAVEKLPDVALVVVGEGPEREALEARVDAQGLQGRIMLTGRLDAGSLDALFRRANLFVMSSTQKSEAFGVVQVEAMAYGLPIVATDIKGSGVPWVSDRGSLGAMAPPADSDALAAAIDTVLRSPNRDNLRRLSRARYETEFRRETMVGRMAGLARGLIGASRTHSGLKP